VSIYPRMVFRPGTMLRNWHGRDLDWQIVDDEVEEAQALSQGWRLSPDPLDRDGDGKRGGSLPGQNARTKRGRSRKVSE